MEDGKEKIDRHKLVESIEKSNCQRCIDLAAIRKKIVVARGNPEADIAIVGINPGANEDIQGKPFVGKAGQLLDNMIKALGYEPNRDFFFTNVVLCHTEGNAAPEYRHINNCSVHLEKLIEPFTKIITMGRVATLGLISLLAPHLSARFESLSATKLLTKGRPIRTEFDGVIRNVFVTYHTSYLLRSGITEVDYNKELYQIVSNELLVAKKYSLDNMQEEVSSGLF